MTYRIDTKLAVHLKERSQYNHNYYRLNNGDVILETCDDDNLFGYWLVNGKIPELLGYYEYDSIFKLPEGDYDVDNEIC